MGLSLGIVSTDRFRQCIAIDSDDMERFEKINELLCDGEAGMAAILLGEFLDELGARPMVWVSALSPYRGGP